MYDIVCFPYHPYNGEHRLKRKLLPTFNGVKIFQQFSNVEHLKNEIVNTKQTKQFRITYPRGDSSARQEERFEWRLNLLGPSRAAPEAFKTGSPHHKDIFPGE